jgi:hypothetical protein
MRYSRPISDISIPPTLYSTARQNHLHLGFLTHKMERVMLSQCRCPNLGYLFYGEWGAKKWYQVTIPCNPQVRLPFWKVIFNRWINLVKYMWSMANEQINSSRWSKSPCVLWLLVFSQSDLLSLFLCTPSTKTGSQLSHSLRTLQSELLDPSPKKAERGKIFLQD